MNSELAVVLVNRSLPRLSCDNVTSDSVGGALGVAEYLVSAGRRRIAMIGGEPGTSTHDVEALSRLQEMEK